MVLHCFPRARFVLLKRDPRDSIRSLVQVKQRLGQLVGLQRTPAITTQVEETVAAHRSLMAAFERSRSLIPADQLFELDYLDLVEKPLISVQRIYEAFGLKSWAMAEIPLRSRIARANAYQADPVQLPDDAQQLLKESMEEQ